jgi:transcriptional regulator with XRE-family HTH domain
MNISKGLKDVRTKKNLTQLQVSKKTKISQPHLSQLEGGSKQPTKKTIEKLCKFYEVPYAVLVWMSIDEKDVKNEKRGIYKDLSPAINGLINEYFNLKEK